MVQNRYPFTAAPVNLKNAVLVVNPAKMDDLFKIAAVSVKAQLLLEKSGVVSVVLQLPAKTLLYCGDQVVRDGYVQIRLPHTSEELDYFSRLDQAEIWEVSTDEDEGVIAVEGAHLIEKKFHADVASMKGLWNILPSSQKQFLFNKYPLFREKYLSVFWGSKKSAVDMIMERLRQRYEERRSLEIVKPAIVVTPNLDHLRMLINEDNKKFQEVYSEAILQTPDGYPPLVKYGRQSLGYQPVEQITGVDMFMQLINTIGRDALPYTIYIVGGFGNVPYQARDFFIGIYPNLAENFVGISTPPMGFLKNEEILNVIAKDIDAKKPDLIFAGMTAPTQELFIHELLKRKVNFGIGFGIGRAIEILTGFQKKEPAIFDRLHLSWIYRALTGSSKDIVKRNFNRVVNDLKFAWEVLTK